MNDVTKYIILMTTFLLTTGATSAGVTYIYVDIIYTYTGSNPDGLEGIAPAIIGGVMSFLICLPLAFFLYKERQKE